MCILQYRTVAWDGCGIPLSVACPEYNIVLGGEIDRLFDAVNSEPKCITPAQQFRESLYQTPNTSRTSIKPPHTTASKHLQTCLYPEVLPQGSRLLTPDVDGKLVHHRGEDVDLEVLEYRHLH